MKYTIEEDVETAIGKCRIRALYPVNRLSAQALADKDEEVLRETLEAGVVGWPRGKPEDVPEDVPDVVCIELVEAICALGTTKRQKKETQ